MMTEENRKVIFFYLKRATSYALWQELSHRWYTFVSAWEYALKKADLSDGELVEGLTDQYKELLDGQIAYEKGLERLKWGERSVFRANSIGYLRQTLGPLDFADRITDPEEYVFDWAVNKDELLEAFARVNKLSDGIIGIYEQTGDRPTAPFRSDNAMNIVKRVDIPPGLPDVPLSKELTTFTRQEVPVDGIWEPEWETELGLGRALRAQPAELKKGCMNYLIAGTKAPYYRDTEGERPFRVTWRLIWEDARYKDGTIPVDERRYGEG